MNKPEYVPTLHYYYEFVPNQHGSVQCGTKNRQGTDDKYHCAHQPQCDLFAVNVGEENGPHWCSCFRTYETLTPTPYNNWTQSSRYIEHFSKETYHNPYSKVIHPPLLMYIIHSKYTSNKTEILFVSDKIDDVVKEVKRMNTKFGKKYWTWKSWDDYNESLISMEKEYKDELIRVNNSM